MDDFFNHRFASKVESIISKMDSDAAEVFSRMVVHDVLHQHIADNKRVIKARTEEILKSIDHDLKEHLDWQNPNSYALSDLTSTIAKADRPAYQWDQQNPWVRRDPGGKFARKNQGTRRLTYKESNGKSHLTYQSKTRNRDETGNLVPSMQFDITQALGDSAERSNTFADRWMNIERSPGTNQRTYDRVATGSGLLRDIGVATGNTQLGLAGEVGSFAGSFGPQAEKVIGPSMRKTAYRYRGTERKIDPQLDKEVSATVAAIKASDHRISDDQAKVEGAQQAAIRYYLSKLPKKKLADLQKESGQIPPSQGVIIDDEGEVTTQAVGYMEDHYLPFNLKNLKKLQGGQYVRTRSTGGPTAEDIYTGLMSGARSMTVVSRSGIFIIDFEDDFRGQRRYSDKAKGMVKRYTHILDAIQSEKVERRRLSPEERADIRESTETEFADIADSFEGRQVIEQHVKDRERQYSITPHLTPKEIQEVNRKTLEAAQDPNYAPSWRGIEGKSRKLPDDPKQRLAIIRNDFLDEAMAEKEARTYRLDGEGYTVAMQALQEQFPYYIKDVRSYTKVEGQTRSREKDTGYVRPNYNRPKDVRAGYFDPEIEYGTKTDRDSGKYSAAETNYQNQFLPSTERARKQVPAWQSSLAQQKEQGSRGAEQPAMASSRTNQLTAQQMRAKAEKKANVKNVVRLKEVEANAAKWLSKRGDDYGGNVPQIVKDLQLALPSSKQDDELTALATNFMSKPNNRTNVLAEIKRVAENYQGDSNEATRKVATEAAGLLDNVITAEAAASRDPMPTFADWDGHVSPLVPKFPDINAGQSAEFYAHRKQQVVSALGVFGQDDADSKLRARAVGLVEAAKKVREISHGDTDSADVEIAFSAAAPGQTELMVAVGKEAEAAEKAPEMRERIARKMMERAYGIQKLRALDAFLSDTPVEPKEAPANNDASHTTVRGVLVPTERTLSAEENKAKTLEAHFNAMADQMQSQFTREEDEHYMSALMDVGNGRFTQAKQSLRKLLNSDSEEVRYFAATLIKDIDRT